MLFNFARFFQQYGMASQLDPLLEKKDVTLETILDEENILNELKNAGANKFANFIMKNPKMYQQMIHYIIDFEDSEEKVNEKKRFVKFPFMISEIFAAENSKLIDYLFGKASPEDQQQKQKEEPEGDQETQATEPVQDQEEDNKIRDQLLPLLLSFVEKDAINMTSAGYFSKTMQPIIKKRGYDLWRYIVNNPEILAHFMKHIDVKHICDVVEKLIILDTQAEQEEGQNYFEERLALLKRLIEYLDNKQYNTDAVENISETLCEIIHRASNNIHYSIGDAAPLIDLIKSKVSKIYEVGSKTLHPSPIQVLISLAEFIGKAHQPSDDQQANETVEPDYSIYIPIIPELTELLKSRSVYSGNFTNSNGELAKPLSLHQMKVARLIILLLHTNDSKIQHEFWEKTSLFANFIELVKSQENNNQLHLLFEKLVHIAVGSPQQLLPQLLDEHFLEFIAEQQTQPAPKGYRGIFTRISNYLVEKSQSISLLKEAIARSPKFSSYVQNELRQTNEREQSFLCGVNPKPKPYDEDDSQTEQDVQKILEVLRCDNINQKFNHSYPPPSNNDDLNQDEDVRVEEVVEEIDNDEPEQEDNEHQEKQEEERQLTPPPIVEILHQHHHRQHQHQAHHPHAVHHRSGAALIEEEEIQSEYLMNHYWKQEHREELIDEALREFESN